VGAIYHNTFDFKQVRTYSTYDRNSLFSEAQNISDITRNSIEIAIDKAMLDQDLTYNPPGNADIMVSFHIIKNNSLENSEYNKAVLFCDYCLRANSWYTEGKELRVELGSLVLDLINPKNKRSVWRSVYPLDIEEKDNSRKENEKILQAVKRMLLNYPK